MMTDFVSDRRLAWIAEEWKHGASELAIWAMENFVNRRNVWGQYTLKNGEVNVVTLPAKSRRDIGTDMVTLNKLRRHFAGKSVSHLIGLHAVSDHETCRWFAVDVDLHDELVSNSDEIAQSNLAACLAWARKLREHLLDPCIIDSNGVGGFHILVFLDREYPLADVHAFVEELRSDYQKFGLTQKPEIFPSKGENEGERLGNWLRLPGRHHTRPHFSRVWNFEPDDGNQWLEGSEAIEAILNLRKSKMPQIAVTSRNLRRSLPQKPTATRKPRVCLDLDRVLAKYDKWQGPEQIGPPNPGALEFACALAQIADIIIFTSRCSTDGEEQSFAAPGQRRIRIIEWLEKYKFPYTDVFIGQGKPRAAAFVDDRAVHCNPQEDSRAFERALVSVQSLLSSKKLPRDLGNGDKHNMDNDDVIFEAFKFALNEKKINEIVKGVRSFYRHEYAETYSEKDIRAAIKKWFDKRADWLVEGMEELFTTPHYQETRLFHEILTDSAKVRMQPDTLDVAQAVETAKEAKPDLFNGNRIFDSAKLEAMIVYIVSSGKQMYKTKLNKLLFYADFVNYYMMGRSISGANYVHLPFGPVPDQYEISLKEMSERRAIRFQTIKTGSGTSVEVLPVPRQKQNIELTPEEQSVLDWVMENYGSMTTKQIVEHSHREQAYRFTKPNEKIAYGYAKFFENLPKKKKS